MKLRRLVLDVPGIVDLQGDTVATIEVRSPRAGARNGFVDATGVPCLAALLSRVPRGFTEFSDLEVRGATKLASGHWTSYGNVRFVLDENTEDAFLADFDRDGNTCVEIVGGSAKRVAPPKNAAWHSDLFQSAGGRMLRIEGVEAIAALPALHWFGNSVVHLRPTLAPISDVRIASSRLVGGGYTLSCRGKGDPFPISRVEAVGCEFSGFAFRPWIEDGALNANVAEVNKVVR